MAVEGIYSVTAVLCVTLCSYDISHDVCQIIPLSLDTTDLLLAFGIKETECVKASGHDPQTCAFRTGFFVVRHSMSSKIENALRF